MKFTNSSLDKIFKIILQSISLLRKYFPNAKNFKSLALYHQSILMDPWRTRKLSMGGVQGYGRPRRGSGGGAPRMPEKFRKFAKYFRKIAKTHHFSLFFKIFTNPMLNFCSFGRKIQLIGKILRKF